MNLGNIDFSPIELQNCVNESNYNAARVLKALLDKLSVNQRKNEDIYINRVVYAKTGDSKDDKIMERYLCIFPNPEKFETLKDERFFSIPLS